MLKEIFHDSFENFEITRICMENHASVTGWQKLLFSYKCFQFSAAVAIATFEIYGRKFSGYLILICSFSLCWQNFSKVNCFRVHRKLITWASHAKSLSNSLSLQTQFQIESNQYEMKLHLQTMDDTTNFHLYIIQLLHLVNANVINIQT